MAYRELGVIEVREVLRGFCTGDGQRAIARATRVDRKTVAKFVAAASSVGLRRGYPGPTEEQVAAVVAAGRGTPGGRPADVPERLAVHRPQIEKWLAEGLRLTKIYRRLRDQGVTVPYSSLHRFAQAQLGFGTPAITVRVAEPPPGEAAEADFGALGLWTDPATGQRRRVHGLLVTLCHSRYAFLAITLRQDLPAVLEGLEAAWTFFGGVVKRLVYEYVPRNIFRQDRARDAAEGGEGLDVPAQEALQGLVEGEASVDGARPAEHEHEAGQHPSGAADHVRAEVAPVDLGLLARQGLQAEEGFGAGRRPDGAHIAAHLSGRAGIAAGAQHLVQPGGAQARVLLQGGDEEGLVGIEGAGPHLGAGADEALALDGAPDRVVMQAEGGGDGADAPVLGVEEAADLGVLRRGDHGRTSAAGGPPVAGVDERGVPDGAATPAAAGAAQGARDA